MKKSLALFQPILIGLTILAAPIVTYAGAHTGPPKLASVDPYIHRTNFVVADMDRALRLYRDILGFEVNSLGPASPLMDNIFEIPAEADTRIAFLSSTEGGFGNIGITEVKGFDLPPAQNMFPTVFIIEIQREIDDMVAQLKAEGLEIKGVYDLKEPLPRVEIVFTDHDGHRVLLMRLPRPE
jgi:catechol 2,3-dioxygenase-like lactoylglutathione lyase family enzyme